MRWDSDTAIGGTNGRFPSTQLTLLQAASAPVPGDALDRVIELYWKPVYCFIRFKYGRNNEDAKDLTQSFFASAMERKLVAGFDPSKASFRTYLRMAAERFCANQHAFANRLKRGGDTVLQPLEENSARFESPEELYEREWRRQLFSLAIDDLRGICEAEGKLLYFEIFQAHDLADQRPGYAELARVFGVSVTAVTNYLSWTRRVLRTRIVYRLHGVTSGDREVREEMRRLWI